MKKQSENAVKSEKNQVVNSKNASAKSPTVMPVSRHNEFTQVRGITHFIDNVDIKLAIKGIDIKKLNEISKLMTITPARNKTMFNRNGSVKVELKQPVSGVVDAWLYKTCTGKILTGNMVKTLAKTAFNCINNTAKCAHLDSDGQIEATLTQVIQSLMAHRPESKGNSVKKLVAMGYTPIQADKILSITKQLAHGLRPTFMAAKKLHKASVKAKAMTEIKAKNAKKAE